MTIHDVALALFVVSASCDWFAILFSSYTIGTKYYLMLVHAVARVVGAASLNTFDFSMRPLCRGDVLSELGSLARPGVRGIYNTLTDRTRYVSQILSCSAPMSALFLA